MTHTIKPVTRVLVLALVAFALGGCGSDGTPAEEAPSVYVSLGDSVAAGSGATDADQTSFPAIVARESGYELINLAKANATTADVLDVQRKELEAAVAGRGVALITISAGGNDLAELIANASCQEDPVPGTCPLDDALFGVAQRLSFTIAALQRDYPDTPIVMLGYPNFFSGTGHPFEAPAGRVLSRLTNVMQALSSASEYQDVTVATPSFEGRGGELTHVLDEQFDPHPNDAGHHVIAEAMLDAIRSTN